MATDTCVKCQAQIHREVGTWVDNTGGDVCGSTGSNDLHVPSYDEAGTVTRQTQQQGVIYACPDGTYFVVAPDGEGRYWYDTQAEAMLDGDFDWPVIELDEEPED